jgi:hypothetical protein
MRLKMHLATPLRRLTWVFVSKNVKVGGRAVEGDVSDAGIPLFASQDFL